MDFIAEYVDVFYALGLIVVILYSIDRFNTPESNRLSTTSSKYYTGLMMYLSAYIFLYHVFLLLPDLEAQVNKLFPDITWLPKELVAALLLTILLPAIPYVKGMDSSIKNKIYDLVNIPQEVYVLVKKLRSSSYKNTEEELNATHDELVSYGFNKENMDKSVDDLLVSTWLKVTMFKNKIKDCKDCGEYKLFNRLYKNNCEQILEKYDELMPLVLAYVNSSHDGPMKDADMSKKLHKIVNSYLDEIYKLMARAVFSKSTVLGKSNKMLEDLGFVINEKDIRLSWDMLSLIFMSVFILFSMKFVLDDSRSASSAFLLAFQIAISYCIAVFWAVYPKMYWPFAVRGTDGARKYSYYLIAVLLTILFVLIVRVLVQAIKYDDLALIYSNIVKYAPWQIPSASLTLLLCYLLDNKSVLINRWFEGILGAIFMCFALAYATYVIDIGFTPFDYIFPFLTGLIIFSYVPHWYRRSQDESSNDGELIGEPLLNNNRGM